MLALRRFLSYSGGAEESYQVGFTWLQLEAKDARAKGS
jgi:hypothetical protein